MQPRFIGHTIFCRDIHKAARFYADVFGWPADDRGDGHVYISVPLKDPRGGELALLLHPTDKDPDPVDLGSFEADDVDALVQKVESAGGSGRTNPQNTPWGVREASVTDLDGNGIYLEGPIPP